MDGMQVKQLSCYYPSVRPSRSNDLPDLAHWNFKVFLNYSSCFLCLPTAEKAMQVFCLDISIDPIEQLIELREAKSCMDGVFSLPSV